VKKRKDPPRRSDGHWENGFDAEKSSIVNFIAAFQAYFSQSLHLAFLLRYAAKAQRAARDLSRDHIRNKDLPQE
jgi:hypothetical protein